MAKDKHPRRQEQVASCDPIWSALREQAGGATLEEAFVKLAFVDGATAPMP